MSNAPPVPGAADQRETLAHRYLDAFDRIDTHLDQLSQALMAAQPKLPGAITLERHNCGPGCLGCPHPRWKVWRLDRRHVPNRWYASNLEKNPSLALKKKGPFAEQHGHARAVIQEIQATLEARAALVDALAKVGRVLASRRLG